MIELKVLKRDLKENNGILRSKGLVPAVMYGPKFESTPISVNDIEFRKLFRQAGKSTIITTTGDIAGQMVVIQDMSTHVVSGNLLHIDFKVTEKGEKTEITVPFNLTGESPAIKNNIGILNFGNQEVTIETIPSNIPNQIDVDISILKNLGDGIKISDIIFPKGVDVVEEMNFTIVSIVSVKEEMEETEGSALTEPELVDQKGKDKEETE
jgi:large subunit ribosomal protein L25